MFNSSLTEGGKMSVFDGRDVIANRERRGRCNPSSEIRNVYVFKDVRVRVYTARVCTARGLIFFDDGEEGMPLECRKDVRGVDSGLPEERDQ